MAYIDIIELEEAEGELREVYEDLVRKRGKLAGVHKIQSLHPRSIIDHMNLYMTVMFGKSPLRRVQREMMAVVVSKANDCEYCQEHHAEAVLHYWKEEDRVRRLREDPDNAELEGPDLLLCKIARELTLSPNSEDKEKMIGELKQAGFSDRAILDAMLVIGYFNFVNRIVLGLGVDLEEEGGEGYAYD